MIAGEALEHDYVVAVIEGYSEDGGDEHHDTEDNAHDPRTIKSEIGLTFFATEC